MDILDELKRITEQFNDPMWQFQKKLSETFSDARAAGVLWYADNDSVSLNEIFIVSGSNGPFFATPNFLLFNSSHKDTILGALSAELHGVAIRSLTTRSVEESGRWT